MTATPESLQNKLEQFAKDQDTLKNQRIKLIDEFYQLAIEQGIEYFTNEEQTYFVGPGRKGSNTLHPSGWIIITPSNYYEEQRIKAAIEEMETKNPNRYPTPEPQPKILKTIKGNKPPFPNTFGL